MDCRNARVLMANEASLAPDQRQALRQHLAECAACRDDHADPIGQVLHQSAATLAAPPPALVARVLQRLPDASPLELWQTQQLQAQQRARRRSAWLGLAALAVLAGGLLLRPWWRGTLLALLADAITQVMATASAPLTVMLGSALAVGWLLRLVLKRPAPLPALGVAGLALLLCGTSLASITIHDRVALTRATPQRPITTIAAPIALEQAPQGAISLLGDLRARGPISGSLVTLAGRITIEEQARVAGDVLAGAGVVVEPGGQVRGQVAQAVGGPVLSTALRGEQSTAVSPLLVRGLALLLGAALALALAALLILLWPQRSLAASQIVAEQPGLALGLGLTLTMLLALLALPVLALLALTIAGLALVPLLLLGVHLVYVQGLAAVGQALGQRLSGATTLGSALWGVAVQLALVLMLSLVSPWLGLLAFYLIASLGLGAYLLQLRRTPARRTMISAGRA